MRIKLHIKCMTGDEDSARLKELGVDIKGSDTEYRPFRLDPDMVIGYYPDKEGGCFVMVGDVELSVQEDFETLERILE